MTWSQSNVPRLLLLVVLLLAIAGFVFWTGAHGWMSIVAAVGWWLIAVFGPAFRRWFSIDVPPDDLAPPQTRQWRARYLTRLRWTGVAYGIVFALLGLVQLGVVPQFAVVASLGGDGVVSFVSVWFLASG